MKHTDEFLETISGICDHHLLNAVSRGYQICLEGKTIQGLDPFWYDYDDICKEIADAVTKAFETYGFDACRVVKVELHGSRLRGTARDDSDLDAVVEYDGPDPEDSVFDLLHDPEVIDLAYGGIPIDINPIKEGKSGNMESYMERSAAYDREVIRGTLGN